MVGDLTGYAAATYLRGIDFIQIPTSLLSQVDSSIGGKTGVDFDSYKNMVGAFHMPKLVYMNLSVLKTLSNRQFCSGMGEIIKHGLIKNANYFTWLKENEAQIAALDLPTVGEMIYESNVVKKNVVENDPTEKGERALLNFGHTLGHAIEKYMNFEFLHGECVLIGCALASIISYKKEYYTGRAARYPTQHETVPCTKAASRREFCNNRILYEKRQESHRWKNQIYFVRDDRTRVYRHGCKRGRYASGTQRITGKISG